MSGSHLCIPRNETVITKTELYCSVSQFRHSYIFERFIYFQDRSAYSAAGKYVDQSWEYINRSQTHACGNWEWCRAIPRKWIHKWDFPCSAARTVGGQAIAAGGIWPWAKTTEKIPWTCWVSASHKICRFPSAELPENEPAAIRVKNSSRIKSQIQPYCGWGRTEKASQSLVTQYLKK